MKLELGYIPIDNIKFAERSYIEGSTLYVSKEELSEVLLQDENILGLNFAIALPGDNTRITPVKDVIEPRVKVDGKGGMFPGVLSKVDIAGSGRTHVLKGAAVVTTGKIVGFQEGIIDMSGPGAEYTPFSKTCNLVLVITPKEDVVQHEHEYTVRMAGLRAAAYLGELARELEPEIIETYEFLPLLDSIEKYPDLPRVGYVQMLQSQGLLHDTYVYGVDAKRTLPTLISPTEVMDGAIISGNCVSA